MNSETFHTFLFFFHIYLYLKCMPKPQGKMWSGGGKDATPCLHGTMFQRAHCDPVKENHRNKQRASVALCHSCHSARSDKWRAIFTRRVNHTPESPLDLKPFSHFNISFWYLCVWEGFLSFFCQQPDSALPLTYPIWWDESGVETGAENRQVFRCVMSDMPTQHEIITGRRQVWQQHLPDHDYIISEHAVEGQGRGLSAKVNTHETLARKEKWKWSPKTHTRIASYYTVMHGNEDNVICFPLTTTWFML